MQCLEPPNAQPNPSASINHVYYIIKYENVEINETNLAETPQIAQDLGSALLTVQVVVPSFSVD